jgi:hypothetical protein
MRACHQMSTFSAYRNNGRQFPTKCGRNVADSCTCREPDDRVIVCAAGGLTDVTVSGNEYLLGSAGDGGTPISRTAQPLFVFPRGYPKRTCQFGLWTCGFSFFVSHLLPGSELWYDLGESDGASGRRCLMSREPLVLILSDWLARELIWSKRVP